MRAEGTYGSPPRTRLRCFYIDQDGVHRKHGYRPEPKPAGAWDELPGGKYSITEAAIALADLARGITYTEAARRAQTARRAAMPPHYSTGALDRHIAAIRQQLQRPRWTFRNVPRMNALLGLVRLHVNRRDVPADWAWLLAAHLAARPAATTPVEAPVWLPDGSREYSLRKHPVTPRR